MLTPQRFKNTSNEHIKGRLSRGNTKAVGKKYGGLPRWRYAMVLLCKAATISMLCNEPARAYGPLSGVGLTALKTADISFHHHFNKLLAGFGGGRIVFALVSNIIR